MTSAPEQKNKSGIMNMAYLSNGIVILLDEDGRVYRTTDYAVTWADLGVIAPGGITCITYRGNGIAVMDGRNGHIYRSTDYGATWAEYGNSVGG